MRLFNILLFLVMLIVPARLATSSENITDGHVLPTPIMRTVNPETVKAGEVATVTGDYLDRSRVAEVYLTDGNTDVKVEVIEQTIKTIKIRVPAKTAAGRYGLMVLMVSDEPTLIEEPVHVKVE